MTYICGSLWVHQSKQNWLGTRILEVGKFGWHGMFRTVAAWCFTLHLLREFKIAVVLDVSFDPLVKTACTGAVAQNRVCGQSNVRIHLTHAYA